MVAILQGMDIQELPRTLQELLMDQMLPRNWSPPPRKMAYSSAAASVRGTSTALALVSDPTSANGKVRGGGGGGGGARTGGGSDGEKMNKGGGAGSHEGSDEGDDDGEGEGDDEMDVHGMKPELIQELTEAFKFVDTDDGGEIDANELKFAARALGFEPNPEELKAMLDAIDEDGGGTVDLGEFIRKITERLAEVTQEEALDVGFDCFDVERKGFIVLEDVARAAKVVGDNVTSEELEQLMNLGQALENNLASPPPPPPPGRLSAITIGRRFFFPVLQFFRLYVSSPTCYDS